MLPKASSLYRAIVRRDPRWDGRFFTAVLTTGIYCRPVCPARTPLFVNVRFYETAAQAEAAGFRACRRCRPEAAPGSPRWIGSTAIVPRALRRLDPTDARRGAADFASRFGLGERQLRRLFLRSLGATPAQLLRARRLQLARQLLLSTDRTVAEIAELAGFHSLRQFNDAYRRRYAQTPSQSRKSP